MPRVLVSVDASLIVGLVGGRNSQPPQGSEKHLIQSSGVHGRNDDEEVYDHSKRMVAENGGGQSSLGRDALASGSGIQLPRSMITRVETRGRKQRLPRMVSSG